MSELILKTDGLQIKAPNGRTLVSEASFEVRSGECIAIGRPVGSRENHICPRFAGSSLLAVRPLGVHLLARRSCRSGLILPSFPSRAGRCAAHSAADGSL